MTALLQEIAELAAWINRIQEEGGIVTNDEAWEVVGHAAPAFLPDYCLVSWDGLKSAIFEPVAQIGDQIRLRLLTTTVADMKYAIVANATYTR